MLTNTKYLGESAVLKTTTAGYSKKTREKCRSVTVAENDHDPIISHDMFLRVQQERERRSTVVRDETGSRRKSTDFSAKAARAAR